MRSAQSCRPPVRLLLVADDTCRCVQVDPPSVDVATITGSGTAWPFSWLRNATLQAYTRPKNGLVAALSAHTASLSENSAEFWRLTITGGIHALLCPAIAPARSSVRETAMASNPLNALAPGKFSAAGRPRAERERRVTVADQPGLEVAGYRADRAGLAGAGAGRKAAVCGLGPGGTAAGGEVHPGKPDAGCERAGAARAGCKVNLVVGPRHGDLGVQRVDGDRRLVLLVLRERAARAAGRYQDTADLGRCQRRRQRHDHRCNDCGEQATP